MGSRSGKLANRRDMDSKEENVLTASAASIQAQAPVKYNLPISVTLRKKFYIEFLSDEERSMISFIKTGNTLVITDVRNKRLFIFYLDSNDIHYIPLSYTPNHMTVVNINTVAVSCTGSTILIINTSTGSVTSTINTSGLNSGISYNDNNLYVAIGGGIIHVMNLSGKVIRTIPSPSHNIDDITVDRDRLVIIFLKSIFCCSLDGQLIWKFSKDTFQDLRCVTTDDEGNVYVTDGRTITVTVVSGDGKQCRELLTKSDGLKEPRGIYFDHEERFCLFVMVLTETLFF